LVIEEGEKVAGLLVFPRDPQVRLAIGGLYSTENDRREISAKELPDFIQSHNGSLIAL